LLSPHVQGAYIHQQEDGFANFIPIVSNLSTYPYQPGKNSTKAKNSICNYCVFPFKLWDREYRMCTNTYTYPNQDKFICATEVNTKGELVAWAYCDQMCPGASAMSTPKLEINSINKPGSCYCGVSNTMDPYKSKIVGGVDTSVGMLPWQVGLLFSNKNNANQGCGGTLVSDLYVLTAAHCTDGAGPNDITVNIGDTILGTPFEAHSMKFSIESIIQHPNYNGWTLENDISILKLAVVVDLYSYPNIKPACLLSYPVSAGKGVVSGWGTVTFKGHAESWLQDVNVDILPHGECGNYYSNEISEDMLCAGDSFGGKDACQGDSGGPLVANSHSQLSFSLIGVVSWGSGCGKPGYPGIYANISFFADFLHENMPDLYTCPPYDDNVTIEPPSPEEIEEGGEPCNQENTWISSIVFEANKIVQSKEACRDFCKAYGNDCDYFNFKDSNEEEKRMCYLLRVEKNNKHGYVSGSKDCVF